jgi:hypothetical protein
MSSFLLHNKKYKAPRYPLLFSSLVRRTIPPIVSFNNPENISIHKENEILPTIKWEPTNISVFEKEDARPEKIGFIILRNVNSSTTNEYWRECYKCIKQFYTKNRILIIDDNSDYSFVTNDYLDNTMIIRSEYPKRGEFLPYYYYLKTNFCETAVFLHDSVFIKKYIDFNVSTYKILLDFGKQNINDGMQYQKPLLNALNNTKLNDFYNKKDNGMWKGCFGAMSVVTYSYLKSIDQEFRISSLIPHITSRDLRCAFERIIGCLLQINMFEKSLFGDIMKYCPWGLNYSQYLKQEYDKNLPVIKVWTGR